MQRDSYFDNFKGILIVLVVVGHFISPLIEENHFANFLEMAIYSFHMPAFVFISAYFSKRNSLLKLVKTLIIPYIIFQFIYFLFGNLIWDKSIAFELFHPDFTLWFLLSLFWWRILIDKVLMLKYGVFILILLGILVGFDTSIGTFGSLERTLTFFPYFVLGYQFNKDKFMKLADKKATQILSVFILLAVFSFLYIVSDNIPFDLLTQKYSYKKIGLPQWGWLYRASLYALSTLLIYVVATLIPRQKHWYSYLGQRTMGIYLVHGLIYRTLEYVTNYYDLIDTNGKVVLTVLLSVVLTFLLSSKPFDYCIKKLIQIPIEKLLKSV